MNPFEPRDTASLISEWGSVTEKLEHWADRKGRIEHELTRRMQADGATVLPHSKFDVVLKSTPSYDYGKLAGLREIVPPEELARAYVEEHEETVTVREKWDMRKALTFRKFGHEVQAILEGARIEGAPRISIKPK